MKPKSRRKRPVRQTPAQRLVEVENMMRAEVRAGWDVEWGLVREWFRLHDAAVKEEIGRGDAWRREVVADFGALMRKCIGTE